MELPEDEETSSPADSPVLKSSEESLDDELAEKFNPNEFFSQSAFINAKSGKEVCLFLTYDFNNTICKKPLMYYDATLNSVRSWGLRSEIVVLGEICFSKKSIRVLGLGDLKISSKISTIQVC